jgi:hypothetical protein
MKTLRKIHLYLGCVFAPLLIFFALSGAWQTFALHRARKDASYSPPAWITALSEVHQHQRWPGNGVEAASSVLLRCMIALMSCGLIVTAVLGVIMAFKAASRAWLIWFCLICGVVAPVFLLLLERSFH